MSYVDASAGPQRRFHARVTTRSFACCAGGRPIWAIMAKSTRVKLRTNLSLKLRSVRIRKSTFSIVMEGTRSVLPSLSASNYRYPEVP